MGKKNRHNKYNNNPQPSPEVKPEDKKEEEKTENAPEQNEGNSPSSSPSAEVGESKKDGEVRKEETVESLLEDAPEEIEEEKTVSKKSYNVLFGWFLVVLVAGLISIMGLLQANKNANIATEECTNYLTACNNLLYPNGEAEEDINIEPIETEEDLNVTEFDTEEVELEVVEEEPFVEEVIPDIILEEETTVIE